MIWHCMILKSHSIQRKTMKIILDHEEVREVLKGLLPESNELKFFPGTEKALFPIICSMINNGLIGRIRLLGHEHERQVEILVEN